MVSRDNKLKHATRVSPAATNGLGPTLIAPIALMLGVRSCGAAATEVSIRDNCRMFVAAAQPWRLKNAPAAVAR